MPEIKYNIIGGVDGLDHLPLPFFSLQSADGPFRQYLNESDPTHRCVFAAIRCTECVCTLWWFQCDHMMWQTWKAGSSTYFSFQTDILKASCVHVYKKDEKNRGEEETNQVGLKIDTLAKLFAVVSSFFLSRLENHIYS